jgi:uncharacterized protein YbaP (TraB family)
MKNQKILIGLILIIVLILVILTFFLIEWESNGEIGITDVTTIPFLWRIEGDNPSYLYGSIHLADERLLTLPDIVMDAIEEVDVVYTETKLDQESQSWVVQFLRLPSGKTLYNLLPEDVIDRVESYLNTKGLSTSLFAQYKIWFLTTNIVLLDELSNQMKYPSLDQYIWNTATSRGKITGGIETVEEQISVFDSFSIDEQIEMLTDTLDELEAIAITGENPINAMKEAYLDGNLEVLQDLLFSDYEENDTLDVNFKTRILTDRNINMTQRISKNITNNPDTQYFFTIGAGHYWGDYGIISLLENQGFTITRVEFKECNSCDSGERMINQRCYEPYVVN